MARSAAFKLLALGGLLVLAPAPRADDRPPKEAPAYTGVYHVVGRAKDKEAEDWKYPTDDTITIAVLNKQSRWDQKNDGTTRIIDSVSRYVTLFGGKIPANTAVRSRTPFVPIGWEFGTQTIDKAVEKPAEVVGTATIAGQPCTRLRYDSPQFGTPEFCVSKTGIVLRFANLDPTAEITYEATSIDEKAPDPDRFTTPAGYKVEEREVRR